MDEEEPPQDPHVPMPIKRITRDEARLWFIQAGGYISFRYFIVPVITHS